MQIRVMPAVKGIPALNLARFVAAMQSTGAFSEVEQVPLLGGVAYIYRGIVA